MSHSSSDSTPRKKKKLGNYPIWGELFGITLSLLVIGLYGMLFLISYQAKEEVISNVEMQVYLQRFITPSERIRLEQTLANREFVLNTEEEPGVQFVSKEQEAQRLIAETGEEFVDLIGENPLHDVLVVRIQPEFVDSAAMANIKISLEEERGVFEVNYQEGIVKQINDNLGKLAVVALSLAGLIILVVIVLIRNTIKLALFSQRFLIRSMQLVGAKPSFVQGPFLRRSLINGLLAGFLASLALYGLFTIAAEEYPKLQELKDFNHFLILFAALHLMGGLLATWSTWRAVRKYLRMSLDDLY